MVTDFKRLTPPFENNGGGQSGYRIDVRDPMFSLDGSTVFYDYGEGTSTSGFSRPWMVSTAGGEVPTQLPLRDDDCTIIDNVSTNPKTGELLVSHDVCIQEANEGIYLYPPGGGTTPEKLFTPTGMSLVSSPPRWTADGSAFLFTAIDFAANVRSLYVFDTSTKQASVVVEGTAAGSVMNGTLSPDGNVLVYCVRTGDAQDLRVVDLTTDPPTDSALTNDGASCDPVF